MTAMHAGEKMIGIPTLHPERAAFRPSLTLSFTKAAYIGFNTAAEQELAWISSKGEHPGRNNQHRNRGRPCRQLGESEKAVLAPGQICGLHRKNRERKAGKLVRYYSRYAASHPDAPQAGHGRWSCQGSRQAQGHDIHGIHLGRREKGNPAARPAPGQSVKIRKPLSRSARGTQRQGACPGEREMRSAETALRAERQRCQILPQLPRVLQGVQGSH